MFNVIKGEMTYQASKPVIIGKNVNRKQEQREEINNNQEEENLEIINLKKEEIKKIEENINLKKEELNQAINEIENLKENSKKEIEEMYKNAEEKIEYEINLAKNKGYQEGYQEGINQGKEEVIESGKNLIIRAQSILEEIVEYRIKSISSNEEELINLALKLSEKIIKKQISEDREIIRNNLKEAVKKVPISKELTIMVNWEDLEYIKEIKDKLIAEINGVEKIEVIENSNIDKGGCILETSMGTIDASINSQLEIIYEKFMEIISNESCNKSGCELEVE